MPLLVGTSDQADFATLADALADAKSGAVIELEAGTYSEELLLTFPVTIRAAKEPLPFYAQPALAQHTGQMYACVVWQGKRAPAVRVNLDAGRQEEDSVPTVTLQGIELQAGRGVSAIEVQQGNLRLSACVISSASERKAGQGITVGPAKKGKSGSATDGFAQVHLEGCLVRGEFSSPAILLQNGTVAKIERVHFSDASGLAVSLSRNAKGELLECQFQQVGSGVHAEKQSEVSLKLCQFRDVKHWPVELVSESRGELVGCDFFDCPAGAVHAIGKSRLALDRCEFERLGDTAIVLDSALRSILKRVRAEQCSAPLLSLTSGTNANLQNSVLREGSECCTTTKNANWQLAADCHLLLEDNRGSTIAESPTIKSAGDGGVVECPFCYERIAVATGKAGATCLCPACGWTFASDKKGKLVSTSPLEIRCQGELCEQVFPAAAAGSDHCPDCLTLCSWDDAGYPTQTGCPECDSKIPLPRWSEGQLSQWCACPQCKGRVRVDRQGMILEFGEE